MPATATTAAPTGEYQELRVHALRLTQNQRDAILNHLVATGEGGQTHWDALKNQVDPTSDIAYRASRYPATAHNPWSALLCEAGAS